MNLPQATLADGGRPETAATSGDRDVASDPRPASEPIVKPAPPSPDPEFLDWLGELL